MTTAGGKIEFTSSKTRTLCLLIGFLMLLGKHLLVIRLPIEARNYGVDDLLMVRMAEGLVRGNWLGDYGAVTLMKGCFFPMLLAGIHKLGISYLSALDILYGVSCVFFVRQMRHLLKNRVLRLILLAILLFDPCSYSLTNFQRVYRNSIVEMQVLFLFGGYFGLYFQYRYGVDLPKGTKTLLPAAYALFSGLVLWATWNSREDSAWLLPFVMTASALTAAEIIRRAKEGNAPRRNAAKHLLLVLLPFLILAGGNQLVSLKNEQVYGARVRLEEADGNFGKALKTMYSIQYGEELPQVSVSREKLERLYACSPALALIRTELDDELDRYSAIDRRHNDGETEDGWFFWGLKQAAFRNGIADTLPKSQAFWLAVHQELQDAVHAPDSDLKVRATMPSALMSPWRQEYGRELPAAMLEAAKYLVSYREVAPSIEPSGKAGANVTREFEMITGNLALYSNGFSDSLLASQNETLQAPCRAMVRIGDLYRAVNKPLSVISLCAYAALLILWAKTKNRELIPGILVILGMGLSILVVLAGTCYAHISAFPAIKYYYLIGAYPLMLGCEGIAVLFFAQQILKAREAKEPANGTAD